MGSKIYLGALFQNEEVKRRIQLTRCAMVTLNWEDTMIKKSISK